MDEQFASDVRRAGPLGWLVIGALLLVGFIAPAVGLAWWLADLAL